MKKSQFDYTYNLIIKYAPTYDTQGPAEAY